MDGRRRRAEGCAAAVKEAAVFAFRSGSGEERKEASESGAGSGSMKEGTVSGAAAPADSVARLSLRGRGHWEDRDAGCGNRGPPLAEAPGRSGARSPSTHPKGAVDRASAAAEADTPGLTAPVSLLAPFLLWLFGLNHSILHGSAVFSPLCVFQMLNFSESRLFRVLFSWPHRHLPS